MSVSAMAELILQGPGTSFRLAGLANVTVQRPDSYHPHFMAHPGDVATEIVVVAKADDGMNAAANRILETLPTIIRQRTVVECIRRVRRNQGEHVAYIYCYPDYREAR